MIPWRMQKRSYKVSLTIGGNGAFAVGATAFMSGRIPWLWSSQTALMDGSALSSMESWPQCILVEAQKTEMTVPV